MRKLIFIILTCSLLSAVILPHSFTIKGKITDEKGNSIAFASILIKGTKVGVSGNANGEYSIDVPNEATVLLFNATGFQPKEVVVGQQKTIDITLLASNYSLCEVVVTAAFNTKRTMRNVAGNVQSVSPGQWNAIHQANNPLSGKVAGLQINGSSGSPEPQSSIRLRGASSLSNTGDDYDREGYNFIQENEFLKVNDNPLSTFSIDVDAASYSNVRRILNSGRLPGAGAVRIEEMINYFKYDYPQPKADDPFTVNTEISECPWNKKHRLALIGLQGKIIPYKDLPAANIVFLIDVSGSMQSEDKLPLVKQSLKLLVDQLRETDKVSLCVYAGNAGLVLASTPGTEKQKIKDAVDALESGGSTAGGAGINLAYKTAKENFIPNGNNRVILCTDGDFNVGVSSDDELVSLIEKEREASVFLTVLGFGTGNYQDAKMQKLADKGNGNHAYIDQLGEAKKVLVSEFGGTIFTIAKDVKLQVEFNPGLVQGYRLIGYENRMLAKEDFNDDKKDAGEMGSGHTVTALYEIIPVGIKSKFLKKVDTLKYQVMESFSESAFSDELMTVKLRYKDPMGNVSKLMEQPVLDERIPIEQVTDNYRFAAAVAEFGMLLRNSPFKQSAGYSNVLSLARSALKFDEEGYRKEFIQLAEAASSITSNDKKRTVNAADSATEPTVSNK